MLTARSVEVRGLTVRFSGPLSLSYVKSFVDSVWVAVLSRCGEMWRGYLFKVIEKRPGSYGLDRRSFVIGTLALAACGQDGGQSPTPPPSSTQPPPLPNPGPSPTPAPSLAYTVDATKRMIAGTGFRLPSKDGSLGSGFTQFAQYTSYPGGLEWDVGGGGTVELLYPNFGAFEGSGTQNEARILTSDITIRSLWLYYTDKNDNPQKVQAVLSNGGVLSATQDNGGVSAIFTLPTGATLPKRTSYTLGIGIQCVDGARLPVDGGLGQIGDAARKHATDNFDAILAAKGALAGLPGSATGTWSGFYVHPVAVLATGNDGRPSLFAYGDSHIVGKGTPFSITSAQRRAGIVEHAMYATSNGYAIPVCNMAIAASSSITNDDAIRKGTRAMWDAVITRNGGYVPWTHYITNEGTNSIRETAQAQVDMINARNNWWRAWHDKPIIQCSLLPFAYSRDGFRTLGNQYSEQGREHNVLSPRWQFNELLAAGQISSVSYGVPIWQPVAASADPTSDDRFKWGIRPFTAQTTRDGVIANNGNTQIFLSAAPEIGENLCLDPLSGVGQSRIVTAVADQGAGEWLVTTDTGSSQGVYPTTKAAGTLVGAHMTADGTSFNVGVHATYIAHQLMIPTFAALKTALRAAGPAGFA